MAIVRGTAYWAYVTTPNTTYEPCYTVNLVVDQATAADFEDRGFNIKQMDEGPAIIIKRKVNGPGGMMRKAPKLKVAKKNEIDVGVGNGSEVVVQYKEWESTWKNRTYKGLDFQQMQVLKLVEYNVEKDEFDIEDDEEDDEL